MLEDVPDCPAYHFRHGKPISQMFLDAETFLGDRSSMFFLLA